MLFSIPLIIFFSSLVLLTNDENNEEMVDNNTEQACYVDALKNSNHQVEENQMNFQRNYFNFNGKFKECKKNHASSIGGYALDGCTEFLPAGAEGTIEFFKCAGCDCHRNFHRKEIVDVTTEETEQTEAEAEQTCLRPTPVSMIFPTPNGCIHVTGPLRETTSVIYNPVVLDRTHFQSINFEKSVGVVNVSEPVIGDGGVNVSELVIGGGSTHVFGECSSNSKRRSRTKFSHDQKEKMLGFAMKLGWKTRKQDENVVEEFCNEIGVKCSLFKVWMNNHKYTLGKIPKK